ncbi:MAG: YdcF family protein, partial [Sphingomonadaceae bacterium]
MILRFAAFALILYVLGFGWFGSSLPEPADEDTKAYAIVALTGGPNRIEQAVDRLADGRGERLLIAGADPLVTEADIIERLGGKAALVGCCVDLGSESVDTRSNAEEAKRWLDVQDKPDGDIWLVTSDWHMDRAIYEFERGFGEDRTIIID